MVRKYALIFEKDSAYRALLYERREEAIRDFALERKYSSCTTFFGEKCSGLETASADYFAIEVEENPLGLDGKLSLARTSAHKINPDEEQKRAGVEYYKVIDDLDSILIKTDSEVYKK